MMSGSFPTNTWFSSRNPPTPGFPAYGSMLKSIPGCRGIMTSGVRLATHGGSQGLTPAPCPPERSSEFGLVWGWFRCLPMSPFVFPTFASAQALNRVL